MYYKRTKETITNTLGKAKYKIIRQRNVITEENKDIMS